MELLEPRQLLSVAFTAGRSTDSHGRTSHASLAVSTGLNNTHGVPFASPKALRVNAISTAKAASASRGAPKLDAADSLMSVSFGGEGFRAITSDVKPNFPTYKTEQWRGGSEPHQWPVLYAASSTLKVSASWTHAMSTAVTGEILARATTSNGLTIAPTPVKEEAGKLILPSVDLPRAAAATTSFGDKASFYPHFVIQWQLSFDAGKSWNDAGQSDNPLYVSASTDPLPDLAPPKFYLTVVDSEINATVGLTAGDQAAIVRNTWSLFAGQAVRQFSPTAPFSNGTEHGRRLKYYGRPVSSDLTDRQLQWSGGTPAFAEELLKAGDGQCTAWAQLFLDMLLVNGVFEKNDYVDVKPAGDSFGFLVKNWNFIGKGTSGNKNYPYVDELGKPAELGKLVELRKPFEVKKLPGVRGQNSDDPLAVFRFHQIARIDGTYYDPSYGLTYTSLDQMAKDSVAGFYIITSVDPLVLHIQKQAAGGDVLKIGDQFAWK